MSPDRLQVHVCCSACVKVHQTCTFRVKAKAPRLDSRDNLTSFKHDSGIINNLTSNNCVDSISVHHMIHRRPLRLDHTECVYPTVAYGVPDILSTHLIMWLIRIHLTQRVYSILTVTASAYGRSDAPHSTRNCCCLNVLSASAPLNPSIMLPAFHRLPQV